MEYIIISLFTIGILLIKFIPNILDFLDPNGKDWEEGFREFEEEINKKRK